MPIPWDLLEAPRIVAAPMAGGANTVELVREVVRCGGVGSFGFAYATAASIEENLCSLTKEQLRCVNANFFIFPPTSQLSLVTEAEILAATAALEQQCPLKEGSYIAPTTLLPDLDSQLESVFRHCPGLLTFHFGLPSPAIVLRAHECGITVGVTVTSLPEALLAAEANVDFVVAQGVEAGGHRGTMDPLALDEGLSTLSLVQALRGGGVQLPVVAAGGLMSGSDIRAALDAGADAVQLGTAFLTTRESGVSEVHKRLLLEQRGRATTLTRAFSGRPARSVENEFTARMRDQPTLPFPVQFSLTTPRRQQAAREGDAEYQAMWAGANYAKGRDGSVTVEQLMQALRLEFFSTTKKKY